jgi:hypothetical protein
MISQNVDELPVDLAEIIGQAKDLFKDGGPPLKNDFVHKLFGLTDSYAFEVIRALLSSLKELDVNSVRLTLWQYRAQKKMLYEAALKTEIERTKRPSYELLVIFYLHLCRELQFNEILEIAENDQNTFAFFRNSMFLIRSYLISRSDIPSFKCSGPNTLPIQISNILPVFKDSSPIQELKKTALMAQVAAVNSTFCKKSNICETARDLIVQELTSSDNLFTESLKKIMEAQSIAIVLKGPSLSKRNTGFIIDRHELTLRVNLADQTQSAIYGKNTDILYHAPFLKNKVLANSDITDYAVEFLPTFNQPENVIECNRRIRNVLSAISYQSATTGFSVILLCLLLCEGQVTVFGFDSYSPSQGEYLQKMEQDRSKFHRSRDSAAPTHEIDYEYWYIHRFCREFLFESKLSLI